MIIAQSERAVDDSAACGAHVVVAMHMARITPTIKVSATTADTSVDWKYRPALLKQVLQVSESSSHSILRVEHRIK